ncbi:MAG: type II toxin-antitoxin system RelE/ParE family toxin [Prevotellaceae bacterium]|nr:type II toxin-antitoxin system RelE/ParE family toxin [Candidatus Colivivens equi]
MRVLWTDFAWNMLSQTADYVLMEFGYRTYEGFLQDVEDAVSCVVTNVNSGNVEPYLQGRAREYRSMVVNKRNKLVYEVQKDEGIIYIIDFWDTRRNPQLLTASH